MMDLEKHFAPPDVTLYQAIECIEASPSQICLVVDAERHLLGTITDGDIRRGLMRGVTLEDNISAVMHTEFRSLRAGEDCSDMQALMRKERIRHIPVLDDHGRVVDMITLDELLQPAVHDNWVVILAGGRGTRLTPLTEQIPKPMLAVGGKPILESTIRRCAAQGFRRFFISINFCGDIIKRHFGDGSALDIEGVTVEYLEESEPLGTAGPLSLLPDTATMPIVVMNGDILTNVDLGQMIVFHSESNGAATMAVREYEVQIPYGVVNVNAHEVSGIREKPYHYYFINAGIYVLDPDFVSLVEKNTHMEMPALFDRAIESGMKTLAFPIREYWVDIGHMDDYVRANNEYPKIF